jgi:prophage regulatory protein
MRETPRLFNYDGGVMEVAILRLPSVKARIGLSKTQIYELVKRGEFPPPFKLSVRASGWDASAVDKWIAEKIGADKGSA